MKKKILSIALVFMLGASVLAGCGQKEAEEPAVKQTQESEPASEEKNTEEKAETENSELSGKLLFGPQGIRVILMTIPIRGWKKILSFLKKSIRDVK